MPKKVAVIGAGIGGIAVSARLAAKGYEIDVFEKNDRPGGKMSEIRHEGFRFDTGPSLFTLPNLIGELFELVDDDFASHFKYSKQPVVCRYFYEDGMIINAYGETEEFAEELHRKAGEDSKNVIRYLGESSRIYDFTYPVFINNSLHRFRNYYSKDFIRALFLLPKLKPFKTLHEINQRSFTHPNTVQLFDRFATYNGSDPFKTPATMIVIPHLEHNLGAYFPVKGMYEIAQSLKSLCERMGVRFYFNCEVQEILLSGNKVAGLRVNGEDFLDYKIIVSDLDIYFLYKKLLKKLPFPEKWFRHERSTSALIFYWGMETESPGLDLHNILFSADYQQEFNCLFNLRTLHSDPTVYIFISSKVVAEDAPAGCENWFVMINTPENVGQDWDLMINDVRGQIEKKIKRITGIDISQHRKFEFILDPRGIEEKTASYRGSLYGNSSNTIWAAFQRHPNFSKIRGLYYTGGSVHPGGGIPLCLSSAKIVADMIPSIKK